MKTTTQALALSAKVSAEIATLADKSGADRDHLVNVLLEQAMDEADASAQEHHPHRGRCQMSALLRLDEALSSRNHDAPVPQWEHDPDTGARVAVFRLRLPKKLFVLFLNLVCVPPERSIGWITTLDNGDGTFSKRQEPPKWIWRRKTQRQGHALCDAWKSWEHHERGSLLVKLPETVWSLLVASSAEVGVSVHDWATACLDFHARCKASESPQGRKLLRDALRRSAPPELIAVRIG